MKYQFLHSLNPTIRDTRKALAASFPGVEFSIEPGTRGFRHLVWTGGPSADDVAVAILGKRADKLGLRRQNTEAEQVIANAASLAWYEQHLAEAPAREAAEVARRAEAKAAGAAKRAATLAAKRDLAAKLAAAFPGVEFSITQIPDYPKYEWSGGPLPEAVAAVTGRPDWAHTRHETAAETAERHAAEARRLAAKAARAARLAARAAERQAARAAILGGVRHPLPGRHRVRFGFAFQASLPMALPHIVRPFAATFPAGRRRS